MNFFLSTTLLLCISTLPVISQNSKIAFEHTSFNEMKAKAKKENKLIFVDAYTTWCGPCKQMDANVFTNDTVAGFFNTTFINGKIDMEKGEGPEIAKLYEVKCYPNLLFIDGDGNLVHRTAGSMSPSRFVNVAKTAQLPESRFSFYKTNYEAKKTDPDFLAKYIEAVAGSCLDAKEALQTYFSSQKETDLSNTRNWNMINDYIDDRNSREFQYVISHKAEFDKLYTSDEVNFKIQRVNSNALLNLIYAEKFDEPAYKALRSKILADKTANEKVVLEADLVLAEKNKDWATYTTLALAHVDTYYHQNPNQLNTIAWKFFENVTDKKALLKAEEWAKQSTVLHPEYASMDTYANLLFKNGKNKQALQVAEQSIEMAKKEGYQADGYQETLNLIEKIKAAK